METEENQLYVQYTNSFKAIKIYDKNLIISDLCIESDLWIDADDMTSEEIDKEVDLILIKLQLFFDLSLNNSIIFCKNNNWALDKFLDLQNNQKLINNNIILVPGEPGDDHLCLVLQSKFDAIGEGKLFFTSMSVKNMKTKNVKFTFVGDGKKSLPTMTEWMGNLTYHEEPWWLRNDLSTIDMPKKENVENPFYDIKFESIMINKIAEYLSKDNSILENENSESKIIRPKFKPKIIKNEE